jgi:hypothetical protein
MSQIRTSGAQAQDATTQDATGQDGDLAAITRTALDYIEGWYMADGERMERSLHPALAKRLVLKAADGERDRLDEMSALDLVQRTRRHQPDPADTRRADITVLDHFENSASVRIDASRWVDYLHLARWNGRWVIVNILWEMRPA